MQRWVSDSRIRTSERRTACRAYEAPNTLDFANHSKLGGNAGGFKARCKGQQDMARGVVDQMPISILGPSRVKPIKALKRPSMIRTGRVQKHHGTQAATRPRCSRRPCVSIRTHSSCTPCCRRIELWKILDKLWTLSCRTASGQQLQWKLGHAHYDRETQHPGAFEVGNSVRGT